MKQSMRQRLNRIVASFMTVILVFTQFPMDGAQISYAEPEREIKIDLDRTFEVQYGEDAELSVSVNEIIDGTYTRVDISSVSINCSENDIVACSKNLISGNIKLETKGVGSAVVNVAYDGVSGNCIVTVTSAVKDLEIAEPQRNLFGFEQDKEIQFKVSYSGEKADNEKVEWESGNTGVISFMETEGENVRAKMTGTGSANISARLVIKDEESETWEAVSENTITLLDNIRPEITVKSGAEKEYDGSTILNRDWFEVKWPDGVSENDVCESIIFRAESAEPGWHSVSASFNCVPDSGFAIEDVTANGVFHINKKAISMNRVIIQGSREYKQGDLSIPDSAIKYEFTGLIGNDTVSVNGIVFQLVDDTVGVNKDIRGPWNHGFKLDDESAKKYTCEFNPNVEVVKNFSVIQKLIIIKATGITKTSDGTTNVVLSGTSQFAAYDNNNVKIQGITIDTTKVKSASWNYADSKPGTDKLINGVKITDFEIENGNAYEIDGVEIKGDITFKSVSNTFDLSSGTSRWELETGVTIAFDQAVNLSEDQENPDPNMVYWYNTRFLKLADRSARIVSKTSPDNEEEVRLTEGTGKEAYIYIRKDIDANTQIYYGPVKIIYCCDVTAPDDRDFDLHYEGTDKVVNCQGYDETSGICNVYIVPFVARPEIEPEDSYIKMNFEPIKHLVITDDSKKEIYVLIEDNAGNVYREWIPASWVNDQSAPTCEINIQKTKFEKEDSYSVDNNLKSLSVSCDVTDTGSRIKRIDYYLFDGKSAPEKYFVKHEYSDNKPWIYRKQNYGFSIDLSGADHPGYELRVAVDVEDFTGHTACYIIYYDGTEIKKHIRPYKNVDAFLENVTSSIPTFALDREGGEPMIKITDGKGDQAKAYGDAYYFDVKGNKLEDNNQGRKVSVSFSRMGYPSVYLYNNGTDPESGTIYGDYDTDNHCYIYSPREWTFNEQLATGSAYEIRIRIPDAENTEVNNIPFGGLFFPDQNKKFYVDGTDPVVDIAFSPEQAGNRDGIGYYDQDVTATITITDPHLPKKADMSDTYFKLSGDNLPQIDWSEGTGALIGTLVFTGDADFDSFTVQATDLTQRKMVKKSSNHKFVIDKTPPVFKIDYSRASNYVQGKLDAESGKYEGKYYYGLVDGVGKPTDVDVTITIIEQNLFYRDVSVKVINEITNTEYDFGAIKWEPEKDIVYDREKDVATATIKIPGKVNGENDGEYRIEVTCIDPVGHYMVTSGDNPYWVKNGKYEGREHVNVIDTVRPKAEFSITELDPKYSFDKDRFPDEEDPADYYNHTFTVTFNVDETNFFNGQGYIHSEVYKDGKEIPVSANEVGYIYAVSANKANEGDYYFSISGNDLAMNKLEVSLGSGCTKNDKVGGEYKEFFTSGKKVLDVTKPTVWLNIDPGYDVIRPNKRTFGKTTRYYFSTGFDAKFTVTEEHYCTEEEFVKVQYGTNVFATNYAEDKVTADNIIKKPSDSNEEENIYHYNQRFDDEGLYCFSIEGEDKAGNVFEVYRDPNGKEDEFEQKEEMPFTSYVVAIDKSHPQLVDIEIGDFYKARLSWDEGAPHYEVSLNHPYQRLDSTTVKFIRSDKSPAKIHYTISSTTADKNRVSDEYTYGYLDNGYVCNVPMNGQQVFYIDRIVMEDYAGNELVWDGDSNKIYLDVTPPNHDELAPTVQAAAIADGSGRGPEGNPLFASDVDVRITVEDPNEVVSSSGLYQLFYRVLVNGEDMTGTTTPSTTTGAAGGGIVSFYSSGPNYSENADTTDEELTYRSELNFHFDKNTYNCNDIKIYVWGGDDAGNEIPENNAAYYAFGIDSTNPTITVSYDNNDVRNEKYFKADRTATVTVMERNFDPTRTIITTEAGARIGGWEYRRGNSANGDDDKWISHVRYDHDGNYTFNVTAIDLVGNEAPPANYGESAAPKAFMVDKTVPVINVTFDNNDVHNGKYYNKKRIADVEITEHNFNAADVRISNPVSLDGSRIGSPRISAWEGAGDRKSASLTHSADGDYTLRIDYTDLAGNVAESYVADEFTIDTTAPELIITGVEDKHAYNDKVAPVIEYSDLNLDGDSAKVEISGMLHKENNSLEGVKTQDENGGSLVCSDIEHIKANDDVYTAVGVIKDLAGNETKKEITFSVNRFGSNYIISDETQQLIDKVYTNKEQSIHVTEINVSDLDKNEVDKAVNGNIDILEDGTHYNLKVSKPGWVQYEYDISAENFAEEGSYVVTLYSEDKAANKNSNRSVRDENGVNELPIEFVVDKTAPSIIVSGVEQNGRYYDRERTVILHYEDNNIATRLEVTDALGNVTVYYLDAYYDGSEDSRDIRKVAPASQYIAIQPNAEGDIELKIQALNRKQSVSIKAVDAAGNETEFSSPRFLLTTNLFVQFINNTAAIIISLVVLALAGAIVVVLIQRRRKKGNIS